MKRPSIYLKMDLLFLPSLVIEHILAHLPERDHGILRQVCKALRQYSMATLRLESYEDGPEGAFVAKLAAQNRPISLLALPFWRDFKQSILVAACQSGHANIIDNIIHSLPKPDMFEICLHLLINRRVASFKKYYGQMCDGDKANIGFYFRPPQYPRNGKEYIAAIIGNHKIAANHTPNEMNKQVIIYYIKKIIKANDMMYILYDVDLPGNIKDIFRNEIYDRSRTPYAPNEDFGLFMNGRIDILRQKRGISDIYELAEAVLPKHGFATSFRLFMPDGLEHIGPDDFDHILPYLRPDQPDFGGFVKAAICFGRDDILAKMSQHIGIYMETWCINNQSKSDFINRLIYLYLYSGYARLLPHIVRSIPGMRLYIRPGVLSHIIPSNTRRLAQRMLRLWLATEKSDEAFFADYLAKMADAKAKLGLIKPIVGH